MSAILPDSASTPCSTPLPIAFGSAHRTVAIVNGRRQTLGQLLRQASALEALLPDCGSVLNLCEDRYHFIVTMLASLMRGVPTLMPPSRAPQVLAEVSQRFADHCAVCDHDGPASVLPASSRPRVVTLGNPLPEASYADRPISGSQLAAIGFTSGSTGHPKAQLKSWASFSASTARNAALLEQTVGAGAELLATVPPQHMYGMETSVLLPLLGDCAIHSARPFFPEDIVRCLDQIRAPRVLVTTPIHLSALLRSGIPLPPLAAMISATAPLSAELAREFEKRSGAPALEVFGSTETCVIAHRFTARDSAWQCYSSVRLRGRPDGTEVQADWLPDSVALQDILEPLPDGRFRLVGRSTDLLEIAGKRASLSELNQRLLALEGVDDGVVFVSNTEGEVMRVSALAVAPGRCEADLLAQLRRAIDPVFLPRPLRLVDRLPRNETGKLPRSLLLGLLAKRESVALRGAADEASTADAAD